MQQYVLVRAEQKDRLDLQRLFYQHGGSFPVKRLITREDDSAWERYLDQRAGSVVMLALHRDTAELVGHLALHVVETLCERYATLEWLLVHPEHRRQGVAETLMSDLIARADDAECAVIRVLCLPRSPAVGLIQSLGFRLVGSSDRHWELHL